MHEAELVFFLVFNDIFQADNVRLPQVFIKMFTVHPAKFSSEVIHHFERLLLEDTLYLAVHADITFEILWIVRKILIANPNIVASVPQFFHEWGSDNTRATGNQDFHTSQS